MILALFLLATILFWSMLVLRATNPVHSVLALVVVFSLTALLFFWIGAEFFAVLLLTVYVGAIAILFLFVVMMLDLRIAELRGTLFYHVPLGASVGALSLGALYLFLIPEIFASFWAVPLLYRWSPMPQSNLGLLGQALYNYYGLFVILVAILLLLAMIGAIVLTDDFTLPPRQPSVGKPANFWNFYWSSCHPCVKGIQENSLDPLSAERTARNPGTIGDPSSKEKD